MANPLSTLSREDKLARLSSTILFTELDRSELLGLYEELEWVCIRGGETLLRQGEQDQSLYVVLTGRFRVFVIGQDGQEIVVGEVCQGEIVGEMAILTGAPRSATVCAIRDSEVARLTPVAWDRLLEKYPRCVMQLARTIAARLRETNLTSWTGKPVKTIAIVPTNRSVTLREFVDRFVSILSETGRTLHLNSQWVDECLGGCVSQAHENTSQEIKETVWFNDLESTHRFLIYEADAIASPWTRQCIRQADRILILCCSDSEPSISQIEAETLADNANRTTARREFVLLHTNERQLAVETAKWIAHRSIDVHHHINATSRSDLERLVRHLTGQAVGLVLSGGGARGFAHIGAIRALREAGIPIDLVGGTSMGALIAAQFALGWNHDTMRRANKDGWLTRKPLRDYTLPLVALNAGRKINAMLTQMFGNIHIEDLWLPYFCVSTDLTRAELLVHRNGPLWESVRASMAIPGIAPPSFFNGNVLVDGGLLNNLPVDIMARFCEGKILAVDVGQRVDLRSNVHGPQTVSGWKLLWNKINPFATKDDIPGIFTILYRTTMINSVRHQDLRENQADFYIPLPVGHIGTLDWQALDQLVEIGYRTTQKKIEEGYRSIRKEHSR